MRYEHAGRFWSITREGTTVTIVHGKIGNKGRTTVKHLATEAEAIAAHDALVIERQREGYRIAARPEPTRASEASLDEQGEALQDALAADPDDAHAFAVYADWLQKQDDPRGELIVLQQAGDVAATGKHLARYASHYLGSLAARVADARDPDAPPFVWRNGFIRRAELAWSPLAGDLAALFALPSAKFLVELALRANREDMLAALQLLDGAPPTLRVLELFARANLDRIALAGLPALAQLSLTARAYELTRLAMPTLRRAQFRAISISSATVEAIAAAPWPVLERLDIRFCAPSRGCEADFHDLRPLLRRADMPALTHLRLRGCAFAGAAVRELAASPLSRGLVVLDCSGGNFTPQDVAALATAAANFPNLVELWVPHAVKPGPLAAVARHVISDAKAPADNLDYELS